MEKMTYSYKAIKECKQLLKNFDWSEPIRKNCHFAVANDICKLQEKLYNLTNCYLLKFDDKYTTIGEYRAAAYYFNNFTQKQLKQLHKNCKRFLMNEIDEIKKMMDAGEVHSID